MGAVLAAGGGPRPVRLAAHGTKPAGRPRQPLARHGRQLDPGTRRGADGRHLLLHLRGPAVDRQGVAVAGPAGACLRCRRLGRRGGALRRLGGPSLRAHDAPAAARHSSAARPSDHRRRHRHDGASPSGAPARARLPADADLGGGPGARRRGASRATTAPAARHAGMGQPAWRLHAGPPAVRRLRARSHGRSTRGIGAKGPVRRMGEVRRCRRPGRLHHAVRAGVDAGHLPHLQSRRRAQRDQRMAVAQLPEHAAAGTDPVDRALCLPVARPEAALRPLVDRARPAPPVPEICRATPSCWRCWRR